MKYILTIWSLATFLFISCETKEPMPDNADKQEGFATGKVVDTNGTPLKGIRVIVRNTMIYATYVIGVTDDNGNYKVELPTFGTFMASAQIVRNYNGKEYTLDLDPDVYEEFSVNGAVRNFTWKITGRRPVEAQGFYGSTIEINKDVMSAVYDSENIEFNLVPVGKLIDGSEGKTLQLKHGEAYSETYGKLVDVPLGRYTVTAMYDGETGRFPLKLRKHFSKDAYADSMTLDFENETMWGNNIAFLSYKE